MSGNQRISFFRIGIILLLIVFLTCIDHMLPLVVASYRWLRIIEYILLITVLIFATLLFIKLYVLNIKIKKEVKIPEKKYHFLYQHAQAGLITTTLDGSQILMANQKALEILGFSFVSELQLQSAYSLWFNPFDRFKFIDFLQTNKEVFGYPIVAMCKNGKKKSLTLYATYDDYSGQIVANIVDSEEKQLYEKSLLYQTSILKNIQESIIVLDSQGVIQFYNSQAKLIFDLNKNSILQDIITKLETSNLHIISGIAAAFATEDSWHGEHQLEVNGEKRIFRSRLDSIIKENLTKAFLIASTDITELVQAREQAEAANLAKGLFLANMSHEIRTPMIGILGAVDLLEQNNPNSKQLNNISIIKKCGEQLLELINDILDVTKIDLELKTLNPEVCNIYDVFYNTIQIIDPLLKEKGLKLELDLQDILSITAYLDAVKFRQILSNLLLNAVKFTTQGSIKLETTIDYLKEQPLLVISLSDTGIGIPTEYMPYIFNPFSQFDNSSSRNFGGAGLGLYICNKLVNLMEGNIEVISELGQGSKFIITLPLVGATSSFNSDKIEEPSNFNNDVIAFIPRSVLIVEDNELNQKIVEEMLLNYGFEVKMVANGLECLQILQDNNFDVILLDMQMPLMDGYETAQLIREDASLKHIPIIAVTAHAMSGDREKCIASGCTSYLAKPFKSEQLISEITKLLDRDISSSKIIKPYNNLFINELIPDFLDNMVELSENLMQAINDNDIALIKSISHDIKGTAGMYGFDNISQTAAQIETLAQEKSITKVIALYKQLQQLLLEKQKEVS